MVLNDSKVIRARLRGERLSTGGAVELLLLRRELSGQAGGDTWSALARPARKLQTGEQLLFGRGAMRATVTGIRDGGERVLTFETQDLLPHLDTIGELPLPPYIVQRRRQAGSASEQEGDATRYQTVYATAPGSVAAPTAGLHFTDDLLQVLKRKGVEIAHVTLHVGAGTFKPVEADDPRQHSMHTEYYTVPKVTAEVINRARSGGRRIIAVGTTVVRTLESAVCSTSGVVPQESATTDLLILPGYRFQVVDGLITNFHLPRSTLLMLVSAFAGTELVRHAYTEAIAHEYRFYSYGDAMLIL